MTKSEWDEYLKRSKKWSVRIGHELIHSEAYQNLRYAPALKVLTWCHEKIKYRKLTKKRGNERYEMIDDGQFSFPYSEAVLRGLTVNQFSRALKDLYGLGFLDVKKFGSGMMEDPTIFTLSERWREYGKTNFISKEWPKSSMYGFMGRLAKVQKQHAKLHVDQHARLHVEKELQHAKLHVENGVFR